MQCQSDANHLMALELNTYKPMQNYSRLRSFFVSDTVVRIIVLVFLAIVPMHSVYGASARYSVKGEVVDNAGVAEMYATIRIYLPSDSVKPAVLGTTDENGMINLTLPSAGEFRFTVAAVGKRAIEKLFSVDASNSVADLGRLVLEENVTELGEVNVVAQRPLVVREIDRLGYDVKADPEAETSTLREILRKVPLVSVDEEGNIKVKGSSDFKIYKNGRPNNSFTKNAKDIFAAIPASSIKKIEVITEPGAREDAEGVGAILNIVTDSDTAINGVVGTVNLYADNNSYIPNPSLWLSTQIDKVTMSVNGGYNRTPKGNDSKSWSNQYTDYRETGNRYESEAYSQYPQNSGWVGFESSWEPDTLNLFTVEANGWFWSPFDQQTESSVRMLGPAGADGTRPLLYGYNSTSRPVGTNRNIYFDGSASYQHSTGRKDETLTLSYRISTNSSKNDSETQYYDMIDCGFGYTGHRFDTKQDFIEQTVQADWSRPYGTKHKLDIGAKGVFRSNHAISSREYFGADMGSRDDFTHRTTIAAAYADYRLTLGKWNFRAGLRYEYSYLSAHFREQAENRPDFSSRLNDLVPNVAVSWNINDANSVKMGFSRNIRRPSIGFLDPSRSETPTSVSYGNPDLGSVVYNNLSFNYSLIKNKFNLDFNLSGTLVDNSLQNVRWIDDRERVVSTYANIGKMRSMNMSVYFQWSIDSKTRWMFNLWGGYTYIRQPVELDDAGRQMERSRARWAVNPWTRISRDLPWKLELSWSGYWWSGGLSDVYSYQDPSVPGYTISLVRKFLKDDRLTVRLNANRLFGPNRIHSNYHTYNPQYTTDSETVNRSGRYVGITFNFRFGSLKAQVKKTAASISNDDLDGQGRGGGGK